MPRRRCVGCGRIAPKSELLRFAVARERSERRPTAVCDRDGRMPGRGAYLCRAGDSQRAAADCLALAIKRGAIARALRSAVTIDPKIVESMSP